MLDINKLNIEDITEEEAPSPVTTPEEDANFEKAKDKILMGAERKTFAMSEDEKRLTAYHEAGHAVVGYLTQEHDPIYKVSIIPRGRALGITMFLPERDSVSMSKRKLEGQIASLYGGRIAEEMIVGEDGVTTGASNDIERATTIATRMVTEWGMSTNLQPIKYVEEEGGYVGAGHSHLKQGLDEVNNLIEKEIERREKALYECALAVDNDANLQEEMKAWDITLQDGLADETW